MKKIVLMIVAACVWGTTSAQSFKLKDYCKEHNLFQHLDASVTLGSTGIGVDVSSPIGNYVNLRAGFDFMPHFHHDMTFEVQVGDDPTQSEPKFRRLSGLLEGLTGYKVDNKIDMVGEPTFYNFKLLADVFPLKNNKKWHITAGFYIGSSKIGLKGIDLYRSLGHSVFIGFHHIRCPLGMKELTVFIIDIMGIVTDINTHTTIGNYFLLHLIWEEGILE